MTLTYHQIEDNSPHIYSVSCSQLQEHLRVLVAVKNDLGETVDGPQVTFDDGHVSNYYHALPLLQKCGVRAIFFVSVGHIGARHDFMSWQQLEEVAHMGHEVQSHGYSHRLLTHCNRSDLLVELGSSKALIEDKLGTRVEALSAPGGRWNARVLDACAEVGYKRLYVSDPGLQATTRNQIRLRGRLMVLRTMNPRLIERYLRGDRALLMRLRMQYQVREILKGLMGDQIYAALWRRIAAKGISPQYHPEEMREGFGSGGR